MRYKLTLDTPDSGEFVRLERFFKDEGITFTVHPFTERVTYFAREKDKLVKLIHEFYTDLDYEETLAIAERIVEVV